MDYSSLKNFLSIAGDLATLLSAGGLVYVSIKTQSFHMLRVRLWQWIFGRDQLTDPTVKEFVDQQSDLMAFRLFSHLQVSTLQEAHQLKTWAQSRGISLVQLSEAHHFFDIPGRCIKKIANATWYRHLNFAGMTTAALLGLVFCLVTMEHRAGIQIKVTGHWYWIDQSAAYPSQYHGMIPLTAREPFVREQCTESTATSLNPVDERVLCSIWEDKDGGSLIRSLVTEQRVLAAYLAVVFSALALWRTRRIGQLNAAKKLQSQINMVDSIE